MKSSKMLEMIRKGRIEVCAIMPVFMYNGAPDESHIVIEVK